MAKSAKKKTAARRPKASGKVSGKVSVKAARKPAGKSKKSRVKAVVVSAVAPDAVVLDRLFTVIDSRRDADPTVSHSARLLSRGSAKVAQKFGEEAVA